MKPRAQSVTSEPSRHEGDQRSGGGQPNEPLSGSKKVKNRNHSRHNNGEG